MNSEHIREVTVAILEGNISLTPSMTTSLIFLLDAASDAYYNVGEDNDKYPWPVFDLETGEYLEEVQASAPFEPILSDNEFDRLEQMLKALDPKNSYFVKVGSDVRGGKVPLPFKMGSLDQVYEGDTEKWVKQYGLETKHFVISDKLDGTSVALIYDRKGNFNSAFSRGNGTMGADITRHIKKLKCVPMKIEKGPLQLRAEAIIPVAEWPNVKAATLSRSGREYKNARNYVAGKMNASDSDPIFIANLHIVITSVESDELGKVQQLELVRSAGFLTNYYEVAAGSHLNDDMLTKLLNERRNYNTGSKYELDGIVLDVDDVEERKALPKTTSSLNPTFARKFKVADAANYAETEVTDVLWRLSKAGYAKPRIEIKPVDLSGVTITYATGFNAAFIRDNDIGPGAIVKITRSGDVIPYITGVVKGSVAKMPDQTVLGAMSYTPGDVDLVLDDLDSHPDVRYYRILDAFKTLDVPHLRQSAVEKLIADGFDSEAKIIKATEAELKASAGDSAGKKIYAGLRAKLNPVDLATLADASQTLGRGIGTRKVTRILKAFGRLDVTMAELLTVDGFEKKTAETFMRNLPKFQAFLAEIDGYYSIAEAVKPPEDGDLKGVVAVFTGVRDKDLEAKIVAKAGIIGSSVNKDTTHLVCKDPSSGSSKMKKAADLGVSIIDLSTAQELWG
ncbi:DNA ligase [compost metagenome]